jgi:predicted permease
LNVDGVPFTVVGVMPPGFRFVHDPDLWRLVHRNGPYDLQRDSHSHIVVGRLKPGVSITQAQSDSDAISAALAEQHPDTNEGKGLRLTDLRDYLVDDVRTMLVLLMATTGLVLLIACGNVAGLLLARGQRRSAEMAMRASLGAARGRLVLQLLTESIVLTLLAGTAGVGVAALFQQLILRLLPVAELGIGVPTIDRAALLFALSVSIATGLVVGVVPALRGTTLDLAGQLKSGTHTTESLHGTRLRSSLVIFQVAVSIVLLIGSGLLTRSLVQLASVELGFEPERLLTGQVQVQGTDYPDRERRHAFFASLLKEIEALPGVTSASTINKLPILDRWQDWGIWRANRPEPDINDGYSAMARWVSPGYFPTMGIPLLQGRDIAETDVGDAPRVVVISRRVVERLFPDDDPIGQVVSIGWGDTPLEVVGVVGDAYLNTLRGGIDGAFYLSSAQVGSTDLRIAVRTAGDPTLLVESICRLVRQKGPNVLFAAPLTMTSIVNGALADFRIVILCLGLFALIALLLTAIGLYGVLAYHVSQRSKEIGIRVAMGAAPRNVLRMILGRGLGLVGIGLLLGLAGGFPATLLLERLLFETAPLDAVTYVSAAVSLTAVSMMACLIPALRAALLSPVDVLRGE